jgi:hypothetical protein
MTATLTEDRTSSRPGPAPSDQNPGPGSQGHPGRSGLAVLASLVINFVAPVAAYYLIHAHVRSSALALALAGAIPVAYTLVTLAVRRRLDPVGVVSVAGFGLGVLVSWASGGNALALELQDPALTGLIGLACLVSVALGRPLHPLLLRLLGRRNTRYADLATRAQRKTSMVSTAIIGLAFTAHAAALAALALTQNTSTFVAFQHPVGLPPFALGIAALLFYRNRLQARQRSAVPAEAPGNQPREQA